MKDLLDFLKEYDIKMVISMIVIMWYFTRDLKMSLERLDTDVRKMSTRISRIEGTLYGKEVYTKVDD